MAINEELQKYTTMLKLLQGFLTIGVPLGGQIVGLIRMGIEAGGADQKTKEEAQAAVNGFIAETANTKKFIQNWQATHPPTA